MCVVEEDACAQWPLPGELAEQPFDRLVGERPRDLETGGGGNVAHQPTCGAIVTRALDQDVCAAGRERVLGDGVGHGNRLAIAGTGDDEHHAALPTHVEQLDQTRAGDETSSQSNSSEHRDAGQPHGIRRM